jgi:hypothetical protein
MQNLKKVDILIENGGIFWYEPILRYIDLSLTYEFNTTSLGKDIF